MSFFLQTNSLTFKLVFANNIHNFALMCAPRAFVNYNINLFVVDQILWKSIIPRLP